MPECSVWTAAYPDPELVIMCSCSSHWPPISIADLHRESLLKRIAAGGLPLKPRLLWVTHLEAELETEGSSLVPQVFSLLVHSALLHASRQGSVGDYNWTHLPTHCTDEMSVGRGQISSAPSFSTCKATELPVVSSS